MEIIGSKNAAMSVSDYAFNYLYDNITQGVWQPGEKIPSENKLCGMLGISRISLRTAISRLSSMRMLESRQGNGTFVCRSDSFSPLEEMYSVLSQADRISMFEFRKIIEVAAAGFAALRATTAIVDAMLETIDRMENASEPRDIARSDMEFHYLIAEATNNSAIVKSFEILRDFYTSIIEENVMLMGSFGAEYHRRILSAIEIRNPDLARQYMIGHLDNTAAKRILNPPRDGQNELTNVLLGSFSPPDPRQSLYCARVTPRQRDTARWPKSETRINRKG